ncbi:thiamine pyrophosphate-binding protein [Flexibacterium corallicola]|uniref:thiamine pyrophosphate-binding protein n=1 Tax=Flexibacterium corallicola TaxID=3037259 RepID=UPI00286F0B96|nr:thiamine pyrophosphate-binding protein [Pseudovibrio sp. M1P-2-3]
MSYLTVGGYLASRLEQIGVTHYFTVPGDYNLVLLDELLTNERLQLISCCNELNAGYAADGYARATQTPGVIIVTYSVGGLSSLNAVAGAFAEDLPLIVVSGAPNTNSLAEAEVLHHTLGTIDYGYQRRIYNNVTAAYAVIIDPREAPRQIDEAIQVALTKRKPVYIEIACNISSAITSAAMPRQFDRICQNDEAACIAAVSHAARLLNDATKPVLLGGARLRAFNAIDAFHKLSSVSGYATAVMADAKSFYRESDNNFIGIYWGPVSSRGCAEIIEASDMILAAGGRFNDYSTVGHAALLDRSKMILVDAGRIVVEGQTYGPVSMESFLDQLSEKLVHNEMALQAFRRNFQPTQIQVAADPEGQVTTRALFSRIQNMLQPNFALIAETGDTWFNATALKLPDSTCFEIQMQYGSIGWSVGAALGYAVGSNAKRRVVAIVGDGSFQVTGQELSTMIRYELNPIIFLVNNGGYTIEVEIHDGSYNVIKNWNYAKLVDVFSAEDGQGLGMTVTSLGELDTAIQTALNNCGVSLIEVVVDRHDCSEKLSQWGAYVAKNNGRPPKMI